VVHEHEVRGQVRADGGGVPLDPRVAFRGGELGQEPRLEILVAVEDEHGKQAARVRPDHSRAADVVAFGMRFLAEEDDVVAEMAPCAGERARVDVRTGPAQEVAVPEENLHRNGS
jgi:hypothetical protein